jgi:hypothetical protein
VQALLLVAFVLLTILYSLNTPLFEAPDEPWHYAYVRWLAEGHGLPRWDDDASGAYQEVAQPPLYYAVAALVSSPVDDADLPELFWHNPQFGYQAGGTVNDNKNMLIHTGRENLPWQGAVLAVRLVRSVSLLFGLLAVAATYGLAREAAPGRPWLALVAAGVVAFTPQFLFISGVVSNDAATAATCTAALWALARIIRRGPTLRRAAVAGLVLGLALLSKTSALLLLPMALLALAWGGRAEGRSVSRRDLVLQSLLLVGVAGAVGGWWYVRNGLLYNDPFGFSVHTNTPWGRPTPAALPALVAELPQVFRSFWGAFGWGHVELPSLLYLALGGLVLLALGGWARHLMRRALPANGAICVLAALWCLVVLAGLLRWMQQVYAPHGRLLFPALGAWGLLLAVGWWGLSSNRYGAVVPVVGLVLLSLVVPFAIIRPAFAQPDLMDPQQALADVSPVDMTFDAQIRLLGYRVEGAQAVPVQAPGRPETLASVTAGGRVRVTLCWEALRPMTQDYTLFVHLLGEGNSRVAERTTYPGQGRFPTSLWPAGRAFCDAYWLPVASWAPGPELYALEVGWYEAESGWRLPARNASGQPVEPPAVGLVRVTPAAPPPPPAQRLDYDLGQQVALNGYDGSPTLLEGRLSAGRVLTLTLHWQALQVLPADYKVFVHLVDAQGAAVTQDDAFPRAGRYPTWAWQPGDIVPDAHRLDLPPAPDLPPGPYRLLVGMYHPDTGERLPVSGPAGPVPDGAILLQELR